MPLDDLKDAISARGCRRGERPDPRSTRSCRRRPRPKTAGLLRRAATEAFNDEGLRFVRHGNVVLPEPVPGQPIDPTQAAAVIQDTLREVLGGTAIDPLPARLQSVAATGAGRGDGDAAGDRAATSRASPSSRPCSSARPAAGRAAPGGRERSASGDVAPGAAEADRRRPPGQVRLRDRRLDRAGDGHAADEAARASTSAPRPSAGRPSTHLARLEPLTRDLARAGPCRFESARREEGGARNRAKPPTSTVS